MKYCNDTESTNPLTICLDVNSEEFNPNRLLNPKETAELICVTPGTLSVWRTTARYELSYIKCGRLVRYRVSDILAFLESRRITRFGVKSNA